MQFLVVIFLAVGVDLDKGTAVLNNRCNHLHDEVDVAAQLSAGCHGKRDQEQPNILLNAVNGRCVAFTGVGAQNIEEIREIGHRSGFVCLFVPEFIPVLITGSAIPPYQLYIVLRQGESGGEQLVLRRTRISWDNKYLRF